jgi:CheY-like chemotaxis protein
MTIVLDIMLPGIDGYQVCKRLREDGHMKCQSLC